MNRQYKVVIMNCIMFWSLGFTVGNALTEPSLFTSILLAVNAPLIGMYWGFQVLEYLMKRKGTVKIDGKLYDLRSRV